MTDIKQIAEMVSRKMSHDLVREIVRCAILEAHEIWLKEAGDPVAWIAPEYLEAWEGGHEGHARAYRDNDSTDRLPLFLAPPLN